ncbi:hypothetical protein D3C74_460380 [compost metagenome]
MEVDIFDFDQGITVHDDKFFLRIATLEFGKSFVYLIHLVCDFQNQSFDRLVFALTQLSAENRLELFRNIFIDKMFNHAFFHFLQHRTQLQ